MSAAAVPVARAAGAGDRFAALHIDRLDAMSGEKSLTPVTMFDGRTRSSSSSVDWDAGGGYPMKRGYDRQPAALEVLRNDRTPLNTPYTPQLVKLHLKRHDEYVQHQQHERHQSAQSYTPAARQFVSSLKTRLLGLAQPVLRIRSAVDRAMELVLPNVVLHSRLFIQSRRWILWYITTVISVPIALLLSPMAIALCICTSPIWLAGVAVLLVRALVPAWNPVPLTDAYVRKASPANKRSSSQRRRHHIGNGESSSHHPNAVYRHANLTSGGHDDG